MSTPAAHRCFTVVSHSVGAMNRETPQLPRFLASIVAVAVIASACGSSTTDAASTDPATTDPASTDTTTADTASTDTASTDTASARPTPPMVSKPPSGVTTSPSPSAMTRSASNPMAFPTTNCRTNSSFRKKEASRRRSTNPRSARWTPALPFSNHQSTKRSRSIPSTPTERRKPASASSA